MLKRQRIVLSVLHRAGRPLAEDRLTRLAFLLNYETKVAKMATFYDFFPDVEGPTSLSLLHELALLAEKGYLSRENGDVSATDAGSEETWGRVGKRDAIQQAIRYVLGRYADKGCEVLLQQLYERHPWFAMRSEQTDFLPGSIPPPPEPPPAIYTVGYEGISIDAFLNSILNSGLMAIIDVRANAVSRKYGFAKGTLRELLARIGVDYIHLPDLGIPAAMRNGLSGSGGYDDLLEHYEQSILPGARTSMEKVREAMRERPAALMCFEADASRCHRGRIAKALVTESDMPIVHV